MVANAPELCPCGKPLHYPRPDVRRIVEKYIAELGPLITVVVEEQAYAVPRHYIALHGLKAAETEALVDAGIIERIPHHGR